MGEVIHKNAAVRDIVADVEHTLTNAGTKDGKLKSLAVEMLTALVTFIRIVIAKLGEARILAGPHRAAIGTKDDGSDKLLLASYDTIYNATGRPGNDPALAILYPGGPSAYTDGPDSEQPDRMDLLAELLEAGIHPRLDPAIAKAEAGKVRADAEKYRAVFEAGRKPLVKVDLLEKVLTALARIGQMTLARLKKRYAAEGFTEVQIHTVIPDRPRAEAKPKEEPKN